MEVSETVCGKLSEECSGVSQLSSSSLALEEKHSLVNSSFENSPLLDREKIQRYGARSRDEFWDALSSNYDYLMDDGLIATCREASSDLSLDDEKEIPESCYWNFTQFIEQFKWLHDLLHNIQVAKEGESNRLDSKILEEQRKIAYLCKLFNDQAHKLSERYPDLRDEVYRHLNRLNNKWKAVELSFNPCKVKSPSKDCVFNEISNRMRNLRKWLRDIEDRLIPVSLNTNWSQENLERRYKEQQEFQKEIESQGKYVSALLKLCEHLKGNVRFGQNSLMIWDAERVRKVACNLQHRWHTLWLKSLECQCILEDLIQNCSALSGKFDKSFSEEPQKKYPRLSGACEELLLLENELREKMNTEVLEEDVTADEEDLLCCDHMLQTNFPSKDKQVLKNDKGVMAGDTSIADLKTKCQNGSGKYEIINQDVGYSSETSAHFSNDEKLDSPQSYSLNEFESRTVLPASNNCCKESTPTRVYLAPDKYPSISLKTLNFLSEDKPFLSSKFGDCKGVPDSFYKVTSVDEEVFDETTAVAKSDVPFESLTKETLDTPESFKSKVGVSNKIVNSNPESSKNAQFDTTQDTVYKDSLVKTLFPSEDNKFKSKKSSKSANTLSNKKTQPNQNWKKSARVREWLSTCQSADDFNSEDNMDISEKIGKTDASSKNLDSSCDASGECTTESDSERSNISDVNNSVTLSQSFTGSIETVIPVVPEENGVVQSDRGGNSEPSSCVRMRKKKKSSRDRPWSVTDVQQTLVSPLVPHSTSESALDMLYSAHNSKKIGSRKLCSDKRLSLTDVSNFGCPPIKLSVKSSKSSSEKIAFRRRKGSEKGFDPSVPEKENYVKQSTVNPLLNVLEDKTEKLSIHDNSSIETSVLSENEKSESVTQAEDHGSISWDEYQDPPYLSEPYSEQTADEDEVKKLINFGDDYRTMLGSYSDTSSISLKAPKSLKSRSKSLLHKGSSQESHDSLMSDSNSDSEDFNNLMRTSSRSLLYVSNILKENKDGRSCSEFAELLATCQTNLCQLHAVHNELVTGCELESLSKEDILRLQELIKEWEALQVKILEQKPKMEEIEADTIDVHCCLVKLKEKLDAMAANSAKAGEANDCLSQLKMNIQSLQSGLSNLQEMKESVLSLIARILKLIQKKGHPSITPLRDSATKLYQQWEDVYELNCSQLTKLQGLQSRWYEPTESEMNSSSETTVHWQPVQVGSNLPTPEVSTEEFFHNTAAEIQVADHHDVLFEIKSDITKAAAQCCIEKEAEGLRDPLHLLSPVAIKTESQKKESNPESKTACNISNSTRRSCFWRTLRASVPIHFALVILYCMFSFMEPDCCENINNFDFSLFPHLRYLRGPPPV